MTIDEVRQFYAEEVELAAPLRSKAVVEAFRRVPREEFLGTGPWQIAIPDSAMGSSYRLTEDAEARHVYHNVSVALDSKRQLFNGQPGFVGRLIDELEIQPGARVFHLGCGPGYYTAILAEVAGNRGQVIASEVDPELAARADANLSRYPNVKVIAGDGTELDPGVSDAMLINAGVTLPLVRWLDRLAEGGRLIVPVTVPVGATLGKGLVLKITRTGDRFAARIISLTVIYSCTTAQDPELAAALGKSLGSGALMKVTSVRRDQHAADDTCLVHTAEICLSSRA